MTSILGMTDGERINLWAPQAGPFHCYMTINVSSWHMAIFPEYHKTKAEVQAMLDHEKEDPMCYSRVTLVYDLKKRVTVYSSEDGKWRDQSELGWWDRAFQRVPQDGILHTVIAVPLSLAFVTAHFILSGLTMVGLANWEYYHGPKISWKKL